MAAKRPLSELELTPLLKRYSSSTLVTLLREIAKCRSAKLDWTSLAKSTATGITSAREYQAVWRCIAYRAELATSYEDNEQPLEEDSDIELELDPVPAVSAFVTQNVATFVKADLQHHEIEEVHLERDVGWIGGPALQAGDVATTTRQQESATSRISNGSATLAGLTTSKGLQYSANAARSSAANGESAAMAPISCTTSTSSVYAGALNNSDRKKRRLWTPEEDLELIAAVEKCGEGNWTSVLKCHYNFDRSASQLSQRWALIRKRREVQEKAGYREGSGPSPSTGGVTEGRAEGSQAGTSSGSSSQHVSPTDIRKPHVASQGTPGDGTLPSGGVPMVAKQPHAPATGVLRTKKGVSAASYTVSTEAGGVSSNTVFEAQQRMRTSHASGVSSSWAGASGQWHQGTMRGSVTSSGAATGTVQAHSTGATAEGGPHPHGPGGTMVKRAAQVTAVVGSQMWLAAALPAATAGSGDGKYAVPRNTGGAVRGSSKGLHGPDPMVQAAAMAAGARIAPASAAASLLMAAQSGNVVHIGTGGVPRSKLGLSNQSGSGQLLTNAPGAIVHYIRTGSGVPSSATTGTATMAQRPPSHHALKSQPSRGFGSSPGAYPAGNANPAAATTVSSQVPRNHAHSQSAPVQTTRLNPATKRSASTQPKFPSPSTPVSDPSSAEQVLDIDGEGTT